MSAPLELEAIAPRLTLDCVEGSIDRAQPYKPVLATYRASKTSDPRADSAPFHVWTTYKQEYASLRMGKTADVGFFQVVTPQ